MFIIKNGVHFFKNKDEKLIIIDYTEGKKYQIQFQEMLIKIMRFLRVKKTIKEVVDYTEIKESEIIKIISSFEKIGIIEKIKNTKSISVAVIGLGTTGSHIFRQITKLDNIIKIVLIDDDRVECDNINRQDFTEKDIGEFKVDVLEKQTKIPIVTYKQKVIAKDEVSRIITNEKVKLIIHAADYPSSHELALIIEDAARESKIPYIINFGYISNVVSLPEFYFPTDSITYRKTHQSNDYELVFLQSIEKASYRVIENLATLVAQQIIDYQRENIPIKHGERGYFHLGNYEWRSEKLV